MSLEAAAKQQEASMGERDCKYVAVEHRCAYWRLGRVGHI